ncbi:DNA polymerase, palm domain, partial [Cinara cedri]
MKDDQKKGYIFEVDLKYPEELHDLHSDYPLAPENVFDNKELPKLTTTLYEKKKNFLHYSNLRLYLSLGLKLEKIHKVIEFEHKDWLRPYIEFNTNLRAKTDNEFEKDYYKLMNNSVFGRTMMNTRNHKNIKLINDDKKLENQTDKPNFDRATIFIENLVATYGKTIRLSYTYTDSLIVEITTDDFYTDVKNNKRLLSEFDFSDYPENNKYGIPRINKKVPGKFKDEFNGQIMTEFVGLRSKLYTYKIFENKNEIKKAK